MKTLSNSSAKHNRIHNHTTVSCPHNYASLWTKKSQKWMSRLSRGLAIAISLSLLAAGKAMAGSFSFTKIVDSSDVSQINIAEVLGMNDSGTVVFIATPLVGERGVYTSNGEQIVKIIDENQLPDLFSKISEAAQIPVPVYFFDSLIDINNNGTVAFSARKSSRVGGQGVSGIFISFDGSFTTRATAISSGGIANAFTNILGLTLNNQDELVYLTKSSARLNPETYRLFLTRPNQPNITIADAGDYRFTTLENPLYQIGSFALNDLGRVTFSAIKFQQIFPPGLSDTQRAFIPSSQQAIFTSTGSELTTLIETGASALDATDENVILSTGDNIQLFNNASSTLRTIVDTNGSFRRLGSVAINKNGNVAFTATLNLGETGIFIGSDPTTDKVIATGDSLGGSTVNNVRFFRSGFNNNGQIAFFARLADGTSGIFRADPASHETSPPQPLPTVEDAFTLTTIIGTSTSIPFGTGNFTSVDSSFAIERENLIFSGLGSDGQRGIYKINSGILSLIVDTNTVIQGGTETFNSFGTPVINGSNVVFSGFSRLGQQGIYIKRGEASPEVVVDINTPIPGSEGNFSYFSNYALDQQNNVVFEGFVRGNRSGIYISRNGALQVVADLNTPIPSGSGNFSRFNAYTLDQNNVTFIGDGTNGQSGIYTSRDDTLQVVVDTNTPIPSGSSNFSGFNSYIIEQNDVAFVGYGTNGQSGIYTNRDGILQVVVDTNTPIPGGSGNFSYLEPYKLDKNNVTFVGYDTNGQKGIYTSRNGELQVVVDSNTSIPSGIGNFTNFNSLKIDGNNIAFQGFGANQQQGYYISRNGKLQVLASTNTTIPGSKVKFSGFGPLLFDGGIAAFLGYISTPGDAQSSAPVGIYANVGGHLLKVIDFNTKFDGKKLSNLSLSNNALIGGSLTFIATFSDRTTGIFRADLIDIDRI